MIILNKILVTGGTGFIGSRVCKKLVELGYEISIICRESSNYKNINCIIDEVDIFVYNNDINELINYFKIRNFDLIIHFASSCIIDHNKDNIDFIIDSDIKFSIHILEAMRYSNCNRILNTSTYGQHYNNEIYNPCCLYAIMKKTFEDTLKFYNEDFDINYITLELFDTYGENDTRNKFLNLLQKHSINNIPLDMSNGEQILDLLYIEDVVSAYLIAIDMLFKNNGINKKYSLQSENRISLRDLVELYKKITNKHLNINYGARPYRKRELMIPWDKGEVLPNWKPKYSLQEGIKKVFINTKEDNND